MKDNPDHFNILRVIKKPNSSQREMANELGLSLGKLNYCIKALIKKVILKLTILNLIKIKIRYAYILTPDGIAAKTKLTINFMKKKNARIRRIKEGN